MNRHSPSLLLVWKVAEFEARQANSKEVEPVHFLIALSKVVDVDLPAFFPKSTPDRDAILEECLHEVGRLRRVFEVSQINAAIFRRRLRSNCKRQNSVPLGQAFLHRSDAARAVFADAEAFAEFATSAVFPIHLSYSVLIAAGVDIEETLRKCQIDETQLKQVTKDEMLRGSRRAGSAINLN